MKKEDSDYYDELFDLFAHPGWKSFIQAQQDAFDYLETRARIDCTDNDSWQFRRGELDKLFRTINYEELIRNDYENLEMESSRIVESNEYDPLH